jgi:predicted amidophosphoribosyltransferase
VGLSAREFERHYRAALVVDPVIKNLNRILLLDDACTEGSTLRPAAQRLREVNLNCDILAATSGQMIVKAVVRDKAPLVA